MVYFGQPCKLIRIPQLFAVVWLEWVHSNFVPRKQKQNPNFLEISGNPVKGAALNTLPPPECAQPLNISFFSQDVPSMLASDLVYQTSRKSQNLPSVELWHSSIDISGPLKDSLSGFKTHSP